MTTAPASWIDLVRTFGPDMWKRRRAIALSYGWRVVAIATAVLSPWPLKVLIDHVLIGRPLPGWARALDPGLSRDGLIAASAAAIVVIAAARAGVESVQARMNARLRERWNLELRDRMLAHLQTLPPTIRTSHRSGELVLRIVGDVDMFVRLQTKTLPAVFEHTVTTLVTLALMAWIAPVLALVTVVLLPPLAGLVRHYGRRLAAASRERRKREGEVAGLAQEIVRGLATVQALGGEPHARQRFGALTARSLEAGVAEARVTAEMEQTLRLVHGVATALMIGGGALLVVRGRLTIGALTVLGSYLVQLLKPVERLNDIAETAARGLAAGERLFALLRQQPAVRDTPNAIPIGRATGEIELHDVWFGYPGSRRRGPVLRGVNLALTPGAMTILVGRSGAGKSTLLHLIVRLFDPTRGVIRLDGRPLADITIRTLRDQIATMVQETHLFAGSLRAVLQPGGLHLPEPRLWQALELVALDDFVRALPDRLDTPLGEDGVNLSGGQRQRLSLARAFLLDRPILLLDEPLANVDTTSQAVIAEALHRVRDGRTCLAITHQPSLFQHADAIYRLEDGRIVEHRPSLHLVERSEGTA